MRAATRSSIPISGRSPNSVFRDFRQTSAALRRRTDPVARAVPPRFRRCDARKNRHRAARRAHGSRRHQSLRRPFWSARRPQRRARRNIRARPAHGAAREPFRRRHRGRPVEQPLRPRGVPQGHRSFRRIARLIRHRSAVGRRRSFGEPSAPARRRQGSTGRHDPHRRALRHERFVRRLQVPPRRALPSGRARRRARPGAHHPDRHSRQRRIPLGVLLRLQA